MTTKKIILVVALISLLTSCSRGWSCKARYVQAKKVTTKEVKNA